MKKGTLNQLEIIDLYFGLLNRKFLFPSNVVDYIRNLLIHYYVHLSYGRKGEGALDQLEIIDLRFGLPSRKLFPSNVVDYIRKLLTHYYVHLSYKRKRALDQLEIIDQGK